MVSQRSLLSAPRLLTILLASFTVLSSVNGATAQDDSDYSSEDSTTINGITISDADQAPDCMYECPALEKYGSGAELPQCITEQLADSPYADQIKSGEYDSDEETLQAINEIMSCICTDVDFVKELADCVFNEPCGNNNTAIYEAISIGYKLCGVMYNVTYPAPTEVVEMLNISVPSGVIVPTTITGVPQATTWPGKTATISSSNPSSTTASSSPSNSTIVTANTNAAMKSSPSYYLVFLAFFAFLAVSVSAQLNGTNPISSTTSPITTAIANGTLTSTSTVSVTTGVSNATLTTSSRTNGTSTTTSSTRATTTSVSSSTTASSSRDASASSTDVPDNAIRNGASFGLVAAGAVAAAFLF